MKRLKVIVLLISLFVLSACSSKFEGTWCKYSDVASTLIILNSDISDEEINNITNYIETMIDLKSYDVIDKIEDASKMITIYYNSEERISNYEEGLKGYSGVNKIKSSKVNEVVDKLVVKKKDYIYGSQLNNLAAKEEKGSYKIDNNTLILDNDVKFYYKNKYLCYDEECNSVLSKAKGNDCG